MIRAVGETGWSTSRTGFGSSVRVGRCRFDALCWCAQLRAGPGACAGQVRTLGSRGVFIATSLIPWPRGLAGRPNGSPGTIVGCPGLVGAFPHTPTGTDCPGLQRAVSPPLSTPAYRRTGRSARNLESMNPPASSLRPGGEFDEFLFAPLGEDRNGLPLSIVSLLGRMDLDPWQEAASLADQPADAAVQRLASLLAALPVPSLQPADAGTMAARLIALLPRRITPKVRSSVPLVNVSAATLPRVVMTVILFAIYLLLLLGSPFTSTRRDPPSHTDTTHTAAPLTAPSKTPPPTE
jgi:hypothetical protein